MSDGYKIEGSSKMIGNLKQKAVGAAGALNLDGPMATILQTLRGASAPVKEDDIAASTGIDKTIITRALQALTQRGQITCTDGDCYSVK